MHRVNLCSMNVPTCAVYIRVSTDRQRTGLEAQERILMEYLSQRKIDRYTIYQDEGVSGAKASRPNLDLMMAQVREGRHNSVLVYSFSRFARSTKHLLDALEEFHSFKVSFVSITESVDTSTPIGRAVFTIISAISQLERELIAERVRNGLANARAKGKRLGRPQKRNNELIRELLSRGLSYRQIARIAKCSHWSIAEVAKTMRSEKQLG
jgi:DNA invertase Pin-like site-specific DNA recombinase